MLADRDKEGLDRSVAALTKQGYKNVLTHTVDATDEKSMQKLVDDAATEMGRVDILVNALGYNFKGPTRPSSPWTSGTSSWPSTSRPSCWPASCSAHT